MSRFNTLKSLWVASLCLGPAPAAWSQDQSVNPHRPLHQARNQDGISASQPGFEALSEGQRAKEERDPERAAMRFEEALIAAEPGSAVYWSALEALNFNLPLMQVEGLIANERWREVEELLGRLIERYESDENKSEYLLRLITQLQERVPDQAGRQGKPGSGREVMDRVEQILERYREEKGRYPRGYKELNEILPADQAPLQDYDIVNYVMQGRAYGLTLRSKADPESMLTVQKSGLMY